ncbi:MAG: hypothetical protein N0C81_08315 [Candidatus Thiodiazotropha lotti]|uniref:Uncharacterized protein n=1 Tax=Candidatus Thiodiazotropha lotti TaxID=2792787 RepID=A0A9E4N257_9GAMM|nr:hypothetical protein [Candidatus Thiodiazotropha lotti]MCG7929726.1 hypothetical protein [Candidatus Thiodiazotropha lotti]MCG7940294.1 hypothetical protein [Candidatus Thiodiazotropha lotti]MCG7986904.1 hypothetical protein [Candidatus Thiodiazotropha lotti]MCG8002124.1 hypothetical protein [Candidatus Thiodiazotropha lotti]
MSNKGSTIYELDADNLICHIDGDWDQFQQANTGEHQNYENLKKRRVLGNELESYVQDTNTKMLLQTVFAYVRQTQQKKALPDRCDSADQKRYLSMQIEPLADAGLRVSHTQLHSEPLEPPVQIYPVTDRNAETVWRCSICNRIESDQAWLEPDEAAQLWCKHSFNVSYTACPVCMNTI